MERFVVIVNDFQPLTIITKRSNLAVAGVLDPPLIYPDYIPYNPCISLVMSPNDFVETKAIIEKD